MATINPVELRIIVGSGAEALIQLSYVIAATQDDAISERSYRELVELFSDHAGIESLIPGGTISDGVVVFTTAATSIVREPEKTLPLAALNQNVSPLQPALIRAWVTLTPLPPPAPSRESNVITLNQPVIATPA